MGDDSADGRGHSGMSTVTCHISISLDGFAAGPNQSVENPIGEGGMRLHQWVLQTFSWRAQHGLEGGERNADGDVGDPTLEVVKVVDSPKVTHVKYRVVY
jgi:hypothetical protein